MRVIVVLGLLECACGGKPPPAPTVVAAAAKPTGWQCWSDENESECWRTPKECTESLDAARKDDATPHYSACAAHATAFCVDVNAPGSAGAPAQTCVLTADECGKTRDLLTDPHGGGLTAGACYSAN